MPRPLEKLSLDGSPYTRPASVESAIEEALGLDEPALASRAEIERRQPGYLPNECIVHLIREAKRAGDQKKTAQMFRILSKRCLRNLKVTVSEQLPGADELREDVLSRLLELIAIDGTREDKFQLDYFEIRFDGAFQKLRIDVIRPHVRRARMERSRENILIPIGDDPTEQITANEQRAMIEGHLDLLSVREREALELRYVEGLEVHSIDPNKRTVAKLMGISDSMVRRYLRGAIEKLRSAREKKL